MFVIVPSDKMINGQSYDFTYKFVWNLGVPDGELFPYVPNVSYLIAQIIGVLAITMIILRDKN